MKQAVTAAFDSLLAPAVNTSQKYVLLMHLEKKKIKKLLAQISVADL